MNPVTDLYLAHALSKPFIIAGASALVVFLIFAILFRGNIPIGIGLGIVVSGTMVFFWWLCGSFN